MGAAKAATAPSVAARSLAAIALRAIHGRMLPRNRQQINDRKGPQGRVYSINHRRDAAAANAKTARRRVAVEDDEDAPPDVAEALPPQVTCVRAWITAGRTDLPDGCSCWTS